jgi:hypothetical protein
MNVVRTLRAAGAAALVGLLCFAGQPVGAQTTTASVSGSVADTQGGFLPGASITLTSNTQGNVLSATTDDEGNFVFNVVRPDSYTLRVSMPGFKTLQRPNVVVNANDKFFTGTLTLDVGEVSEHVTVLARVSELQATSGERSFTLENEAIQNIAVNGRSMFGLLGLVPGVVPNPETTGIPDEVVDVSVNGQRPESNNMTIDGVANIDTGNNGGNMVTTNLDAVAEFKVLTNAYQAEYGRAVGAQVQAVTKSGSQEFHGSGYWYGRRSDWNANSWTNNRDGIEKTESSRNDYGYTLGGPIYIPGRFNTDKRKLFFFFSQEWQRRTDPVAERLSRVPTELERQGDFSQSVDNNGSPFPYIRDYTTGLPCSAQDTRGCFQDGGVLGRIPADRLYQPGLNALSVYPTPNFQGDSGINYRSQAPNDTPRREEMLRIDFQPNDNWRFTGRYMQNSDLQKLPYGTTWAGVGSNNLDNVNTEFDHPGRNWMISATGILDNTTALEISFGQAYNELVFDITNPDLRRTAAGLSDLPLLFPDAVQNDYIPDMRFDGGRVGTNAGRYQTDRGPFENANRTYDLLANITKVAGSHTLKAGVYFQSSWKPQSPFTSFNSLIDFRDNSSNPFDAGFSYANAAIGAFTSYTQASRYAVPEWVYKNFEWYAQDNWKVGRKLTLDYGVRMYYLTPQWDQTLAASTFLPDSFDPSQAVRLYTPVCVGASPCSGSDRRGMDPALVGQTPTPNNTVDGGFIGQIIPGSGNRFNGSFQAGQGVDDQLSSGSAFRVSPRFGFVYDVSDDGSMIVRGGFGIFYDRPMGNVVFDTITNAPGTVVPQINYGLLQELDALFQASEIVPPLSVNPTAFDFRPPKIYAWNVGVQAKLPSSFTLDLAYVGSSNHGLLHQNQINTPEYGAAFQAENQDPTRTPSDVPGQNALPTDLLRPYPGYGNIRLWEPGSWSNYHSLQVGLNRRFDEGLMFNAFYVWSKALSTTNDDYSASRPNATEDELRRTMYSYAENDRPHTFVMNFVYQMPKVTDGGIGVVLNDWQLSGVYRWLSGVPYAITYSIPGIGNENLTGTNQAARVYVNGDPGPGSSSDPYRQIDNPNVFAPPQPGSDGNESARYFLHRPAFNNLDLSLSKRFKVGDRVALEIRLDAFNALNHTQFTGVNSQVSFASLDDPTITNLPYDENGNLVRPNGFGTINGVYAPRTLQLVTRLTF